MKPLEWEKVTHFGRDHFVSGIYKLTSYTYWNGREVTKYWCAYYITERGENWGDVVDTTQRKKMHTMQQCKDMCNKHAETYIPSMRQFDIAARSVATMKENP